MKFSSIIPFCLLIFLWACTPEGLNPSRCRDGKCIYEITADQQIEGVSDTAASWSEVRLVAGAKLVFHYEYEANEKARISDDELWEHIYFELDPSETEFSYTNDELADIQAIFTADCECINEVVHIRTGTIAGRQVDEQNWSIVMELGFEWGETTIRSVSNKYQSWASYATFSTNPLYEKPSF